MIRSPEDLHNLLLADNIFANSNELKIIDNKNVKNLALINKINFYLHSFSGFGLTTIKIYFSTNETTEERQVEINALAQEIDEDSILLKSYISFMFDSLTFRDRTLIEKIGEAYHTRNRFFRTINNAISFIDAMNEININVSFSPYQIRDDMPRLNDVYWINTSFGYIVSENLGSLPVYGGIYQPLSLVNLFFLNRTLTDIEESNENFYVGLTFEDITRIHTKLRHMFRHQ